MLSAKLVRTVLPSLSGPLAFWRFNVCRIRMSYISFSEKLKHLIEPGNSAIGKMFSFCLMLKTLRTVLPSLSGPLAIWRFNVCRLRMSYISFSEKLKHLIEPGNSAIGKMFSFCLMLKTLTK